VTILHVISGLRIGGAESVLVQLATRLQDRGIKQHVVSLTGRGLLADELERHGIPVTSLEFRALPRAIPAFWKIVALVRHLRPHVIQGWMHHGDLIAALAHRIAPDRNRRRLFWGIRASNMDDGRYRNVIRWDARFSRWPNIIIANSEAGAQFHLARGYKPRRLEVIPNGVDIEKFRPDPALHQKLRAELCIDNNVVVAIHVARVDPMKDHATCLAALNALPDVRGLLVGRGTDTLALPDNVRGLGERADVNALYAASDIALSTSAFGEGFSNAIAEGMSSGLAPVVTDVGDVKSIVGETGAVVSPGDVSALVKALRIEADRSSDDRRKRGLAARNRIVNLYSLDRMVERFARLYETPLNTGAV
jgi:glycosyltransferase involved in cell wall biosynthesis